MKGAIGTCSQAMLILRIQSKELKGNLKDRYRGLVYIREYNLKNWKHLNVLFIDWVNNSGGIQSKELKGIYLQLWVSLSCGIQSKELKATPASAYLNISRDDGIQSKELKGYIAKPTLSVLYDENTI